MTDFNEDAVTEQVRVLETQMNDFISDASKVNNKAAARRARKVSLKITKLLLQFRKDSLK